MHLTAAQIREKIDFYVADPMDFTGDGLWYVEMYQGPIDDDYVEELAARRLAFATPEEAQIRAHQMLGA